MTFSTQLQRKLVCNDVRGVILPLLNLLQHQVHIQGGGALAYFQGNVFGEKVFEGEAIIFIAVHARQGHRSGLSNALGGGPDGGFRRSCRTGCILRGCRTRPMVLWPKIYPSYIPFTRPCTRCKSDPHMAVEVTFTTTSSSCSIPGSATLRHSTFCIPSYTIAFIAIPSFSFGTIICR